MLPRASAAAELASAQGVSLPVELPGPAGVGGGNVHDGRHGGEGQHGQLPAGEEAQEEAARQLQQAAQQRADHPVERLRHGAHVVGQAGRQLPARGGVKVGHVLLDDPREQLVLQRLEHPLPDHAEAQPADPTEDPRGNGEAHEEDDVPAKPRLVKRNHPVQDAPLVVGEDQPAGARQRQAQQPQTDGANLLAGQAQRPQQVGALPHVRLVPQPLIPPELRLPERARGGHRVHEDHAPGLARSFQPCEEGRRRPRPFSRPLGGLFLCFPAAGAHFGLVGLDQAAHQGGLQVDPQDGNPHQGALEPLPLEVESNALSPHKDLEHRAQQERPK